MEIVEYLCEFFFEDFCHFVMLFLVCYAISPKHNITIDSPTDLYWGKKEDK